ncbi:MAG: hypothetical protein COV55_03435 [Candidatus Komeilibacteria bacterium CG11_big_fil_rev_8_21_14_0_20_36_20]|uniref:D-Ala-D-Ala dipeptidase n=1 Tax=Candidatus Komeilibacteria bacterium CG11_big_fil_rev_8_21_14_0_20_36_20 TaxID=1974477 RepID=A0A2H0NCD8_9BACT|nr:MAG: hypothetical protein COV55_03435 [Candidatus Komeilibacteria bacterium CG11_big_fil_rev_8_21_14_0_20_36_20]PIR81886.1 MAG: hypothetical protein COU21_00880 [Candidatus Komeilibacteria bacterium CG10_big_fil_rev_8_21_14_0_10_36_65]PJC55385.1 MAG: hypothetical protein CO027_02560 [Candidatus Komeilibacteria bacterium CG_4_9_14_0_2_um_filter_36_13]
MSRKILSYQDLIQIEAGDNQEPLVSLNKIYPNIDCQYEKQDMKSIAGEEIYVRSSVAEKLNKVNLALKKINQDYRLKIVYGYRHPDIQKKYFDKRKKELTLQNPNLSPEQSKGLTHNFVAAPEVAGHVVGGAIDLTITSSQGDLDMGTMIGDFTDSDKIKTFAKNISQAQKENRQLLHDLMLKENFAPFYGEWWHFSYGDKEWAAFYGHQKSLYSILDFKK